MKINKILPLGLTCLGLSLVGCGSNNTANNDSMSGSQTESPISNNINRTFDRYGYNFDGNHFNEYGYNNSTSRYNSDNSYIYGNSGNTRFGKGMKGAENIKGNGTKSNTNKVGSGVNKSYNNTNNLTNNVKNSLKS